MNNPRFEKVLLETGEAHRFPERGGGLVLVREWRFIPGRGKRKMDFKTGN